MADLLDAILNDDPTKISEELVCDFWGNRVLILNDIIEDYILEEYMLSIIKWNRDDKHIPVEDRKKIKIYINSNGGDVFAGNMMLDVILQSKTPIMGIGFGTVASAAYDIYLACDERLSFKNSTFLMHDGQINLNNSSKKVKDTMQYLDEYDERMKDFIISRTLITPELYDSIWDTEFFMSADKAKELGVVHKIVGEDCSLDEIW